MRTVDDPAKFGAYCKRQREKLGLSQPQLAKLASALWLETGDGHVIKYQSIQQLESGAHKTPQVWFKYVKRALDDAAGEAAAVDRARSWRARQAEGVPSDHVEAVPDEIEMIREVDIRYGMGPGSIVGHHPDVGTVPFNRNFRRTLTTAPVDALYMARGDGDSMMPTLINDDQVLIDTSQNRITQSDKIWALSIGEVGLIKRVQVNPKGGYHLLSDNPLVPAQDVDKEDIVVVGRVVWVGRRV